MLENLSFRTAKYNPIENANNPTVDSKVANSIISAGKEYSFIRSARVTPKKLLYNNCVDAGNHCSIIPQNNTFGWLSIQNNRNAKRGNRMTGIVR
jgi:hypothetical protein